MRNRNKEEVTLCFSNIDMKNKLKKKKLSENIITGLQQLLMSKLENEPIALDCEMVGVGIHKRSSLGRISIVSYDGRVLYDVMCRPEEEITDYRTPWSGIRPTDMVRAIPFECVKEQVQRIVANRIVVGHMIPNDFKVLEFQHPKELVRDTGRAPYAKIKAGLPGNRPVALRYLADTLLGVTIQAGEHCSTVDAQATMAIYRLVEKEWEADLLRRQVEEVEKKVKKRKTASEKSAARSRFLTSISSKPVIFNLAPSSDSCSEEESEFLQPAPPLPLVIHSQPLTKCSSSLSLLEDEYWDD